MAPMRINGHIREPTNAVACANPNSIALTDQTWNVEKELASKIY
jgi:hypothetical protein